MTLLKPQKKHKITDKEFHGFFFFFLSSLWDRDRPHFSGSQVIMG